MLRFEVRFCSGSGRRVNSSGRINGLKPITCPLNGGRKIKDKVKEKREQMARRRRRRRRRRKIRYTEKDEKEEKEGAGESKERKKEEIKGKKKRKSKRNWWILLWVSTNFTIAIILWLVLFHLIIVAFYSNTLGRHILHVILWLVLFNLIIVAFFSQYIGVTITPRITLTVTDSTCQDLIYGSIIAAQKLFVFDKNTWNRTNVCKSFV